MAQVSANFSTKNLERPLPFKKFLAIKPSHIYIIEIYIGKLVQGHVREPVLHSGKLVLGHVRPVGIIMLAGTTDISS